MVLTRISLNAFIVDQPSKKMAILDEGGLTKLHELPTPENNGLRSTLLIKNYLFAGFSNGIL